MWTAYDYQTVSVVGVTFNNKDGSSRQQIIKELYEYYGSNLCVAEVKLRERTYKGDPAVAVYIDDKQVGFLDKELAADLAWQKEEYGYSAIVTDAWIVGGPNEVDEDEVDEPKIFGIRLDLEVGKNEKGIPDCAPIKPKSAKPAPQKRKDTSYSHQRSKPKKQKKGTLRLICSAIYGVYGLIHFGRNTHEMVVNLIIGFVFFVWGYLARMKYFEENEA